jgi:hypothetical protein
MLSAACLSDISAGAAMATMGANRRMSADFMLTMMCICRSRSAVGLYYDQNILDEFRGKPIVYIGRLPRDGADRPRLQKREVPLHS